MVRQTEIRTVLLIFYNKFLSKVAEVKKSFVLVYKTEIRNQILLLKLKVCQLCPNM